MIFDFAKGGDTYPKTPQQTLLLLDKYSKAPTVITQSEGTAFAQTGKKKGGAKKKSGVDNPRNWNLTRTIIKITSVSDAVSWDILRQLAQ
jgi:hypothetical protein